MALDPVLVPSAASAHSRRGLRQVIPWLLALAVATCTQDNVGPSHGGVGYFAFRPEYRLAGGASLSQFGIVADTVHIRLTRPVDEVVLDTAVAFPADSGSLHLALPVELATSPEVLDAVISISAGGVVIFLDSLQVTVQDGAPGNTPPPLVTFDYVGPGLEVGSLVLAPADTTVVLGDTLFFAASAFDSSAAPVTTFYVGWSTSDTTVARINAAGRLISPATRGSVQVIGTTPTGIADTSVVTFAPVPVTIYAESGGGQTGLVGDSLAALFVARVMGADSLGIAGIPVRFQAVTAGGTVRDTLVITDALGRARTRGVLGTNAVSYNYSATAVGTGLPATLFVAGANSGSPSAIAIDSGNAQVDTIGQTLPLPLRVRVLDAFGNRVPGAKVYWSVVAGTGDPALDSALTDGTGVAQTGYTLGTLVGTDSIRAQLAGTSAFVTFTATAVHAGPAALLADSGATQSVLINTLFADSLVALVRDAGTNAVPGATVHWSVVSGDVVLSDTVTLTGADGRTRVAVTAGSTAGAALIRATVTGLADTADFPLTVTAGAAAAIAIQGGNGQSDTVTKALALPFTVRVADASDNAIAGAQVVFTVVSGSGLLADDTVTTGAGGLATVGYTLGTIAGTDSIRADLAGTSAFVTFTATGVAGAPAAIASDSGEGQSAVVTTPFAAALVARVVDGGSNPIAGTTVRWSVAAGSATLSDSVSTSDATGRARIQLTAGTVAGPVLIHATVLGLADTATFTATVGAGAPASFTIDTGNGQNGPAGSPLPVAPTVRVRDAQNNVVAGVAVAFTVTAGGGSVDSATATTDSTGRANAGQWILGAAGANQVQATSAAFPADTLYFDAIGALAGATKLWTAAVSTSWKDPANWQPAGMPTLTDTVFIPTGVAVPVVDTDGVALSLQVQSGTMVEVGSSGALTVGGDLYADGPIFGVGTVLLTGNGGTLRGTFNPTAVVVLGDRTLVGDVSVVSNLRIDAGVLSVNGHTLEVLSNLDVEGSGQLGATKATDSIVVLGAATWTTTTSGAGLLTDGVLVVQGGLQQLGAGSDNFAPSGAQRTRFGGIDPQTVIFESPSSHFNHLAVDDGSGVTFGSNVTILGTTTLQAGSPVISTGEEVITLYGALNASYADWQVHKTEFRGAPSAYPDSIAGNVFVNTSWTLSKSFHADSMFSILPGATVVVNGHRLTAGGDLAQNGTLRMQNGADSVEVAGSFVALSAQSGTGEMTAGLLQLHGGFLQMAGAGDNFAPSGTHVTRFEGTAGQAASFATPALFGGSQFRHLELADSVDFGSAIVASGDVTILAGGAAVSAGTATIGGGLTDPGSLGWRYDSTDFVGAGIALPDSLVTNVLLSGSWTVAQRTRITGGLTIRSTGVLTLGADTVVVDQGVQQDGRLVSTTAGGLLEVSGPFQIGSAASSAGDLSAGTLLLHGDLLQVAGAADNFHADGTHLTRFAPTDSALVQFATPGAGASQFGALEIAGPVRSGTDFVAANDVTIAGGTITWAGNAYLYGGLTDPASAGWRVATTYLGGTPGPFPDSLITDLHVSIGWTLPARQVVVGDLVIETLGVLDLGGRSLVVTGDVVQGGRLRMNDVAGTDSLDVGGDLSVVSAQSGGVDLTYGTMLLRGDLTQVAGAADNFVADSSHTVVFTGGAPHAVSFATPGAAGSRFHALAVDDSVTVATDLTVTGDVALAPAGRVAGAGTATLEGDLTDPSRLGWRMGTTVVTGALVTLPDTMTTDLVLQDTLYLANGAQLRVNGDVTIDATGLVHFAGANGTWDVTGNFQQGGRLSMLGAANYLNVHGDFTVNSPLPSSLYDGRIWIDGDFQQVAGAADNFAVSGPLLTYFTSGLPHSITFADPVSSHFGAFEVNGSAITLGSDVQAGHVTAQGGAAFATTGGAQLLQAVDLTVDGASFDRVRVRGHQYLSTPQFDNVTFTNQSPADFQLSLEAPGTVGDTLRFTNVTFDSPSFTSGGYVFVTDSSANDAPAVVAFYNSAPLNGALNTTIGASPGDTPVVLWSHLDWVTQPTDGIELLPIVGAPQVAAYDPSGVLLSGFTGTVTLGLATDPSGGTAVLAGNSVAAVGGIATFDSLTLSLAGVGYQLQAASPALGTGPASAAFTISVPIPAGTTTAFNNGGGDNDWFNAGNWTAGTPDSLDNVFIFPGQTVTVNAPARANRITVGTGAGIVLNAPLAVDSSVAAGNTITGGGQLVAQGTGTLTGQVADLIVTGNYVVPAGGHLSAQTIVIDGIGVLDPGLDTITVTDSLATQSAGILNMNGATALVDVGGDARFGGGQSTLNDGLLRLRKGLYSYHNFAVTFTPATDVAFEGTGMQTVAYAVGDSTNALGRVSIGGDSVRFATPVWVLGNVSFTAGVTLIDSTLVALQGADGAPGAQVLGNTLQLGADLSFPGTYTVGTTIFAGPATTITALAAPYDTVYVSGQAILGGDVVAAQFFVIGSGQFLLNGHRLDVTGDFGTGQLGQFAMTDPADTVIVGGSFYASGGSTTGLLTDGLLQVAGNFIQGSYVPCCVEIIVTGPMPAADGFNADTGHVTRLVGGAGARLVYFSNPLQPPGSGFVFAGASSKFGTLELVDGLDSLASVVPVAGNALMSGGAANGVGTLAVVGKLTVGPAVDSLTVASLYSGGGLDYQAAPSSFGVGETFFFGGDSVPVLPYNWLRVGFTTMALQGDLDVGQVTLGGQGEGPADSYNGELVLNGHALRTTGGFTLAGFGTFRMDQPADSLDVGGSFNANGGSTSGLITDGVIVARGAVYVSPNWEDSSFIATGANRFRMAAAGAVDLGIVQGSVPANRFSKFVIEAGTIANFNQYQNGALIATDSLYVNGSLTQASAGQLVLARGPMLESNGADITVDTVELHQTFTPADAGFNVTVVRYAGNGQLIDGSLSYQQLEVTGFAGLAGSVNVSEDARIQWGGNLDINGFGLNVARRFSVLDSATFGMTDPAGQVNADTAFVAGASTEGALTAGTLRTRALIQSGATSDSSYAPSGTHVTEIGTPLGGSEYLIQFASTSGASHLQDLLLDDGGFGGVPTRIAGRVRVLGKMITASEGSGGVIGTGGATLQVDDSLIVMDPSADFTVDTLVLGGDLVIPTNVLASPVTRFIGAQVMPDSQGYQRVEILGDVTMAPGSLGTGDFVIAGAGHFTLGASRQLIVNGDFATQVEGTLTMNGAGADLFVAGNATFGGGSAVGQLTDGTIRVVGNFTAVPGTSSNETFTSQNTPVQFQGSTGAQQVTIDPAMIGNFRGVQITNPFGIAITGNMVVTDSVGTYGPITGDSLSQFGNLRFNTGVPVSLKVLKTSGLFIGNPSTYTVGRTHIVVPNGLPNVTWDTLVVATTGVSAFYPINAATLIVAGTTSPFGSGSPGTLDLGSYAASVSHTITGDLRIEGTGAHLEIAEDTVNVLGNFHTALGGTLGMNGTGALLVSGSSFFGGGSQIGLLTSGELYIEGDLVQTAAGSPSSFRMDGTGLEFGTVANHGITIASPDSSWLPALSSPSGTMSLTINGRARIAGTLDGYGLSLSGDTLVTDGPLSTGPVGLAATLRRYEGPVFYQFQTVSAWNVATTQFTGDGDLPFNDITFDTLIVSARVGGQLSQILSANRVEVTGPGNPRHVGADTGEFYLIGGDGNTTVPVSGDVIVRGAGAMIHNDGGYLSATGDLIVDQAGLLRAPGYSGSGNFQVDGNVVIDGTYADSLIDGQLAIGGNFTQMGTTVGASYIPEPGFVTQFTGPGTHTVFFQTPSFKGGSGSHFGGLLVGDVTAPQTIDFQGDYWVEGGLSTSSSNGVTFHNTRALLSRINAQDVAVQNITFDHAQFRLEKHAVAAAGFGNMDGVSFTNFQNDELQFVVTLPGLAAGNYVWSNFTFTPLAPTGLDSGRYISATDYTGISPSPLSIQLGTNQSGDPSIYFQALNGATVVPFSP